MRTLLRFILTLSLALGYLQPGFSADGFLFTLPKQSPLSLGETISGAKAYFYAAGTTTPQNTYTTAALATPHANPVVADGYGVFEPIYLDPSLGDYKVVITDSADVTIYTVDNYPAALSQSEIGLGLYPITAAETAASVTPVNYYYEPYNVLRYDADDTGATDSSAAFQAAWDACIQANARVIVPSGLYRLDSQVTVDGSCDYYQAKSALISSYVTGAVDGYNTAGFALLIDGMSEANWYGLNLDFENGTAGIVMRTRNDYTRRNTFFGAKIDGGVFNTARQTRTKIALRVIGNEASSGDTGYLVYFNRWISPHFVSASTLVDLVSGDGDASTLQPNAQFFIAPVFEDYVTAVRATDTDEHQVLGAFWQLAAGITSGANPTATQTGGTATASHTSHGYETGDIVTWSGANEADYNGAHRITVTSANAYTFTIDSGAASPATGTITSVLNTNGFRGESAFSHISGVIDAAAGAYPYWLYDNSGATLINLTENTAVAGVFEDTTDNVLSIQNSRINGLARINDRDADVDGDGDLDIFGTGSAGQGGAGNNVVRIWGSAGTTRNIELGVNGTTATIEANVANTDLALGAGGETVILLDDSLDQAVIPTGKFMGFTDTQTTVGGAGGASALPGAPTGYILVRVAGAQKVIPYWDPS